MRVSDLYESICGMQLPEGMAKVNTSSFQLLRIVWGHMRKLTENIQVCGVTYKAIKHNCTWLHYVTIQDAAVMSFNS